MTEPNGISRVLSPDEEKSFRQWARDHYIPGDDINPVWHDVVRDECAIMNDEHQFKAERDTTAQ